MNEALALIVGGYDPMVPNVILNQVMAFDIPLESKPNNMDYIYELGMRQPMLVKKTSYASLVNSDMLYIIGGKIIDFANERLVDSGLCEIYAVEADSWSLLPSLNVARSNASACSFQNRFIYVFGGNCEIHPCFQMNEHVERLDLLGKEP